MRFIRQIPNILTTSRFIAAGLLVFDALDRRASVFFALVFIFAALTDFLDGFIARKLKLTSIRGSILDGYADIALYGAALVSICLLFPQIIRKNLSGVITLLTFQALSWGFSLVKFSRLTSYHTYLAKAWSVMLFVSLSYLFAFSKDSLLLPMFIVGGISITEDIAITAILPYWKTEITGFAMALRLRAR
ncbi:MAG: CDP-alcohol phosphatidyltransferase family protein [Candidatus Omnitrophota bacterium]